MSKDTVGKEAVHAVRGKCIVNTLVCSGDEHMTDIIGLVRLKMARFACCRKG